MPSDRKFLWGEAYSTAAYLYNRRWHSTIKTTPFERLYNKKPTISHLRPWFTNALVHIPSEKRGKFDPTAEEGFLVGYTSSPTVYHIYIPKRHTITEARDIKFDKIKGVSLEYRNETTSIEPQTQPDPPTRPGTPTSRTPPEMPGGFHETPEHRVPLGGTPGASEDHNLSEERRTAIMLGLRPALPASRWRCSRAPCRSTRRCATRSRTPRRSYCSPR